MKINNEFTVSAPIDQAWETMLNLERIAPCLPGAAIQEEKSEGEYDGTMKVVQLASGRPPTFIGYSIADAQYCRPKPVAMPVSPPASTSFGSTVRLL